MHRAELDELSPVRALGRPARGLGREEAQTHSSSAAVVEVAVAERGTGIVERVGCRVEDDLGRLTWATVWSAAHRGRLTRDPPGSIGRQATVTYTHRTIAGALREARVTDLR